MSNLTSTNSAIEEAKKRREAKQQIMQDSEVIREEADKTVQALKNAQTTSNEALQSLLKDVNAVKNSITENIQQGVEGLNTLESKLHTWENQLILIQQTLLQQGQSIQEQAKTIHNTSIKLESNATSFQKATATAENTIAGLKATSEKVETTFNNLNSTAEQVNQQVSKWKQVPLLICGVLVICVLILIYTGFSQKSAIGNAVTQTEQVMKNYLINLSSSMESTVQLANNQLKTINQTMANFTSEEAKFEKLGRSIAAMEAAYSEKARKLSKVHLFEAIQHRLIECSYQEAGGNYGICIEPLRPISDNGRTYTQVRLTESTTPEQLKELKER